MLKVVDLDVTGWSGVVADPVPALCC